MRLNMLTPRLFWITGLPGAGKSTIATQFASALRREQANVVLLDGDAFRALSGNDLGYSPEDRLENAWRIARFCHFLTEQGQVVICATVSLYEEVRSWIREHIDSCSVIYIKVSPEILMARDQKGLYSAAAAGEEKSLAGVTQSVDMPVAPDLVIENDAQRKDFQDILDSLYALAS